MKTLAVSLLVSILAVSTATADDGPRWCLTLTDDSRIVITPHSPVLRVESGLLDAVVSIPTDGIRGVELDGERGVKVELANGDRISGELAGELLAAKALFGNIDILPAHIRRIDVIDVPERAALTEPAGGKVAFPVLATAKITDQPYGNFCVADFNNDSQPDFAVSDRTKGSGVLKGNGDGAFTMGPGFSAKVKGKGLNPCRLAIGDLNKDGHLDFVVEMNNDWAINVHWGNGDGTFTPKYTLPNGQNPGNTKIAHLDNDGWPDIVSGSPYTSLYVHLSDGDAGYRPPVQHLEGTSRRQPIIVGDLDGDEDIDILCARYTVPRYVSIMINDGNGVFTEKGKIDFPDGTGLAKVTDFDFDGKMDFVLGSGNKVLVVPGNADGTFKTPVAYDMGHKVGGLQLHDLNHDGRLDLVYIDYDSHKAIMRLNTTRPCMDVPRDAALREPPGEFQVDYAGLRWDLMRTGWKVEDGKLVSQRHARPGFQYGHWANGRGGLAVAGNGDKSWVDYEVAFDYKMLPANREFFHAHIPGDSRGMGMVFRAKSVTESWNQPSTSYRFGLSPGGSWSLSAAEDWYMTGRGYNWNNRNGNQEKLASGKSESCQDASQGRLRLRVKGNTITVWLNDEKLVEHTHKGEIVHPIPYGGFGVGWRYESMGWISNLKVQKL